MHRLKTFLRRSPAVRILLGFILAAAALALLDWLVMGPGRSLTASFDGSIRSSIRQMHSPLWSSLFLNTTKLGSTIYLAVIGSVAGLLLIGYRFYRIFGLFVVAMVGQSILHNGAKFLVARPRPAAMLNYPAIESFSFPSGHALSSLCVYATLAWLATNRLENPAIKAVIWIATLTIVFLIGISRVYIGIHYPTDVLAGWLAAAIWTAAVVSCDKGSVRG
ncbi:MAG: phosphatase PAP2 family protein [bacterium]|nr:phosphatase PAP2 family protein [bacterium]